MTNTSRERLPDLVVSVSSAAATALLARALDFDRPPMLDLRIQRIIRAAAMDPVRKLLAPLFPIGLPGGYITIGYAMAHSLRRRNRRGGAAIVTAAWLGWLAHRAVKLAYARARPRKPRVRPRVDSYPSGHTTGTTALAITTALVLRREQLISSRRAVAIGLGAPLLMGAYRVIADDHWTTDVVGGWLLGAAIAFGCRAALGDLPRDNGRSFRGMESTWRGTRRRARRG